MKRLTLNMATLIILLVAIFSGFALVTSSKNNVFWGLRTRFWLDIHVILGLAIIILLIIQIILNRDWVLKILEKRPRSKSLR